MRISKERITQALIRLRRCAGWSPLLLFANPEDRDQIKSCEKNALLANTHSKHGLVLNVHVHRLLNFVCVENDCSGGTKDSHKPTFGV